MQTQSVIRSILSLPMAKHDRRGADNDPVSFTEYRIRQPAKDAVVAGRVGGNQEFTAHEEATVKK